MSNSDTTSNGMTLWDFLSRGSQFRNLTIVAVIIIGLFITLLLLGFRFQYRGEDLISFSRGDSPRFANPYRVANDRTFITPCDGFIYAYCPNPPSSARLDMLTEEETDLFQVMTTGDIGSNQSSLFPVRRGHKVQPITAKMQGDVHVIFFPFR